MTTTTDTLTRWLPLWEQDESLRPFNGDYRLQINESLEPVWICAGSSMDCDEDIAEGMTRDAAVGWLYFRFGSVQLRTDGISLSAVRIQGRPSTYSKNRNDALYEACKAVLARDKT